MIITPNYPLIYSSTFFLLPIMYGIFKKKYGLAAVSWITTIASISYWIHPVPGMRYNIDLVISKCSSIIYLIYGYNNVSGIVFRVFGYTNGFMILSFYNTSCILYQMKSDNWVYFHMAFHFCITVNKLLALL